MKTTIYSVIWICLLGSTLWGCKGKTASTELVEEDNTPYILSLENIVNAKGEEFLSTITTDIQYIPLETTNKSLLKPIGNVVLLNNGNFLITDRASVRMFSPEGKYIRKVSQQGGAPAEYSRLAAIAANPLTGGFFIQTSKKMIEFDAEGNYVNNFETEDRLMNMVVDAEGRLLLHRMSLLKSPEDTTVTWALFRYDASGTELKRLADPSPRMRGEHTISYAVPTRPLYLYDNKIRFNEFGNDTVFIVEEDTFTPYAIIDLGYMRMSATPEGINLDAVDAEMRKKLFLAILTEDEHFFYMAFGWGFGGEYLYSSYNKKSKQVVNYGNGQFYLTGKGLTNDIDGGLPFFPLTITPNGTRIMWRDADAFKSNILKKDYEAEKKKYGEKFEKAWQLAQSLKEDDNPILILVK